MGYNLTQINPAYELVSDIVVGTATTTVDFTGLNIKKEDDYMLVSDIYNSAGSDSDYALFPNGDTLLTNYHSQLLYVNGTSVSSNRRNSNVFVSVAAGVKASSFTDIKIANSGYLVGQSRIIRAYGGSSPILYSERITSTFTMTSITSLRINASATNGLGIGSRFQLYKRVAPIVFDYTVTSAITSLDITGLNIGMGSEYALVFDNNNTTAGGGHLKLYFNGTYTDTSYYAQNISADSTTITPVRYNLPSFAFSGVGTKTFGYILLKLTNNGYITYQSSAIANYGGSTIGLTNRNGTSTFTAASITSLRILNEGAGAIGIGSRFQLIKLK